MATITGRVYDVDTGLPISGAAVAVWLYNGGAYGDAGWYDLVTDASGMYTATVDITGVWCVRANVQFFDSPMLERTVATLDDSFTGVDIGVDRLSSGDVFSWVRHTAASPDNYLQGVTLTITGEGDVAGQTASAISDATGYVIIPAGAVVAGFYTATFTHPDYTTLVYEHVSVQSTQAIEIEDPVMMPRPAEVMVSTAMYRPTYVSPGVRLSIMDKGR